MLFYRVFQDNLSLNGDQQRINVICFIVLSYTIDVFLFEPFQGGQCETCL